MIYDLEIDPSKWNPRYLAYARANGEPDPRKMLDKDEHRMANFMIWISEHWREFGKVRSEMNPEVRTKADHDAFDGWLEERYPS